MYNFAGISFVGDNGLYLCRGKVHIHEICFGRSEDLEGGGGARTELVDDLSEVGAGVG